MAILMNTEMNDSHLAYRDRWVRNRETGQGEKKGMDRGWLGLLAGSREWLMECGFGAEQVAQCFVLGVGNIACVVGAGVIYENENNGEQAHQYTIYIANKLNMPIERKAGFPTAQRAARGAGRRTLEQWLEITGAESANAHGF